MGFLPTTKAACGGDGEKTVTALAYCAEHEDLLMAALATPSLAAKSEEAIGNEAMR